MYRILVFSDSHGEVSDILRTIENIRDVDAVIHAGDISTDEIFIEKHIGSIPFYGVRGNNDLYSPYPYSREELLCGKKIFITHGHKYSVKSGHGVLYNLIDDNKYDIVIYGHTHVSVVENYNDCLIINPGAVRAYCSGSYAVIEIENNIAKAAIIPIM